VQGSGWGSAAGIAALGGAHSFPARACLVQRRAALKA
jgi:hypothetical protein